jgi:hypothetical protein
MKNECRRMASAAFKNFSFNKTRPLESRGRPSTEISMKNLFVRIALPLLLAANSLHAPVAVAAIPEQSNAADRADPEQSNADERDEHNKPRFRHDEVAVLFVMGASNSAGNDRLPADCVLTGAQGTGSNTGGMPAPNVWGIRNDGWSNIAGNANGPRYECASCVTSFARESSRSGVKGRRSLVE